MGTISKLVCIFCKNVVALAWMDGELWHGQAQNEVTLAFKLNFTLKVKANCPKNNRDLNQVVLHLLCKFGGSSLNAWWVMAWKKLGVDGRTQRWTHKHTHRQMQATTIPEGQNWPMQVIFFNKVFFLFSIHYNDVICVSFGSLTGGFSTVCSTY